VAALVFAGTAAAAPAHAQPATVVGCDVDYTVPVHWGPGVGFVGQVIVTNTGNVDAVWRVEITFLSSDVTHSWNGVFTVGPQSVIIEPASWDPMLTPGQVSITAGFTGTGDGVPSSISVTCTSV